MKFLSHISEILLLLTTFFITTILSGLLWDALKHRTKKHNLSQRLCYSLINLSLLQMSDKQKEELITTISPEIEWLLHEEKYLDAIVCSFNIILHSHQIKRVIQNINPNTSHIDAGINKATRMRKRTVNACVSIVVVFLARLIIFGIMYALNIEIKSDYSIFEISLNSLTTGAVLFSVKEIIISGYHWMRREV